MNANIVFCWQIFQGQFWTHHNQAVAKGCFFYNRKGLRQVVSILYHFLSEYLPGRQLQQTESLNVAHFHAKIPVVLLFFSVTHPMYSASLPLCPFFHLALYSKSAAELPSGAQVSFSLCITVCIFRNVDECVADRTSCHQCGMLCAFHTFL